MFWYACDLGYVFLSVGLRDCSAILSTHCNVELKSNLAFDWPAMTYLINIDGPLSQSDGTVRDPQVVYECECNHLMSVTLFILECISVSK